jgi:hypothetical protein
MEGCKTMKAKASWLYIVIPVLLLSLSIFVMTSGYWWKNTEQSKEILNLVKEIESNISKEEWKIANEKITKVGKKWEKSIRIIQFGVERDRIFEIDESLAKMKGGILTKNKEGVMQEVYVFYRIWDDLGY